MAAFNCTESLHLPGHPMTAVVLTTVVKLTHPMKIVICLLGFEQMWNLVLYIKGRLYTKNSKTGYQEKYFNSKEVINWRKLHTEELHNFYSSQNVFRINLRRDIDGLWQVKNLYKILLETLKELDHTEHLSIWYDVIQEENGRCGQELLA